MLPPTGLWASAGTGEPGRGRQALSTGVSKGFGEEAIALLSLRQWHKPRSADSTDARETACVATWSGGRGGGGRRELVPSACWAPVWQEGRKYRANVRTSANLNFRNGCNGNSCYVYFTTI